MKICVITGSRSEYGLLYWLIKQIYEDKELQLQLVVTGMHLSPEFGSTWKEIVKDQFPITKKIEILLSSDTSVGVSKSVALAIISFSEFFEETKPDLIILLGDRTETFAAAQSALYTGIPIAHIHGGEITYGAIDDLMRHAVTKLSHIHFTATEEYRKRVIQLGENPEYVFNVGAIGLDNIKKLKLLSKYEFEDFIGCKLKKINFLITFHPETVNKPLIKSQIDNLLSALDEFEDVLLIFTKSNSDEGGRLINKTIGEYVSKNPHKSIIFDSLGKILYLSAIQFMDAVIGNSSSGIIEVPMFNIPTVNIGERQMGRIMGPTIFNSNTTKNEILKTIKKSLDFDRTKNYFNPYGDGNTSEKIISILKKIKIPNIKKKFFDLQFKLIF